MPKGQMPKGLSICPHLSAFPEMRCQGVRRQNGEEVWSFVLSICPRWPSRDAKRSVQLSARLSEKVCPSVGGGHSGKGLSNCRRRGSAKRSVQLSAAVHLSAAIPGEEVWASDV